MVLFTSAIVVGALLLGAALHALLAKSLYTQQSADALQQVRLLTRQNELGDITGFDTKEVQTKLQGQLISGFGGQPNFEAVVLRASDGAETRSKDAFRFEHVLADLAERVARQRAGLRVHPPARRPGRWWWAP